MGRPRKKDALLAWLPKWIASEWSAWRRGVEVGTRKSEALTARPTKWSTGEWDAYRRGVESGQVISRQDDGLERTPRTRPDRLLRRPEVMQLVGVSRATIDRLERARDFPKRVQISKNAVGWHEREMLAWKASRPQAR